MQTTIDHPETDCVPLYYREGNSDTVYQAAIEPAGDGLFVIPSARL